MRVEVPGRHTYVARYRIETNDINDGHLTVLETAQNVGPQPLPVPNSVYTFLGDIDVNSRAKDYDLQQHERDKQKWWSATVTWRPPEPGEPTEEDIDTPLPDRDPRYWIEYNRQTRPVLEDLNGDPILNFAGQPYPEPIVRTYHVPVLIISRWYDTLDEIWTLNETYQDTTNSDEFLEKPAKSWRYAMTRTNEPQEEDGEFYWHGITRIEFKAGGWAEEKREEGWKVIKSAGDNRLITPHDTDGSPLGEPALLETNGTWLDIGIPAIITPWEIDSPVPYAPLIA
jgi:hypothetical protein